MEQPLFSRQAAAGILSHLIGEEGVEQHQCGEQDILCGAQCQHRIGRKQGIEQQEHDPHCGGDIPFGQSCQCVTKYCGHKYHLHDGMDGHAGRVRAGQYITQPKKSP